MDIYALQDNDYDLWIQGDYPKVIHVLEKAIQSKPAELKNYWYLGLAYLLQGDEETAQLIWLSVIAEQNIQDSDEILQSLVQTITVEAERLAGLEKTQEAWIIRQHIGELSHNDLTNLLHLIQLSIKLDTFTEDFLENSGVFECLSIQPVTVEASLILTVLEQILQYPSAQALRFAEACLPHIPTREKYSQLLVSTAATFAFEKKLTLFAIALTELCLKSDPNHQVALGYLPRFHTDCHQYTEAVEAAKAFHQRSTDPESLFFASCVLFQALTRRGDWAEIPAVADQVKAIISDIIQSQSTQLSLNKIRFLIVIVGLFSYLKDDLIENRKLQNQVSQLFLKNIEANATRAIKPVLVNFNQSERRLKIGYIGSTLRNHSVGWLSRWLFQHHDHERFEIFAYLVHQRPDNSFFETWFADQVDQFKYLSNDIDEAVESIRNDELDILVDLDSTTLDQTCTIMALKPAPIQVTWLGFDASGLPNIDYFIADPYVLPDSAQSHYSEKIWRLPQTYIAVDGFETGIPTLSRSDLAIPQNSIVYWSSQTGLKRNPDIVRLQMQILRAVPNSYFLLKGIGDQEILRKFFTEISQQEDVSFDRLRFLPMMPDEYTHRANLQLADVVLDTYPYNGATTTLETLWAGVPLVTRVGQQFAARNSYAFLMNIGVTEGIAWTNKEYVEWGVRLGQDEQLRQQISWKMRQSRHTSSLWNAKQFTRDLESAYRQMCENNLLMQKSSN
jgi:predicted O-linked N-acetylglucosamine transferase (SPINDLY family)